MKFIIGFLFTVFVFHCNAQKIFINGQEGNRPLVWNDFSGKVDKSSEFNAVTYWGVKYNTATKKDGATGKFTATIEFILEMDPKKSWVKKGKETDELLKHEQGHFNTGLLCLKELVAKTANLTEVSESSFGKIQTLFFEILAKYQKIDLQYDAETNHSENKIEQAKWNQFYANELLKK